MDVTRGKHYWIWRGFGVILQYMNVTWGNIYGEDWG